MRLSSIAAAVAALVIGAIALSPSANAGRMLLGLSALIDLPATPNSSGARSIEASVELGFGETIVLCVPTSATGQGGGIQTADNAQCAFGDAPGYTILLSADAAADDSVLIRAHVLSEGETTMPETASAFLIKLDSWAAMQTNPEHGAQSLRLTFFPRRL